MHTYISTAIDSVQYAKTQFLNTFVKEESIRKPLQDFVNAQALFARNMVNIGNDLFQAATTFDISKYLNPVKQ